MPHRSILITGVTRGLGRAMAEAFVSGGHTVVGCGRDKTSLLGLQTRYRVPHRFDRVDIADPCAVEQWASELETSGFVPDLLLNNAAVIHPPAPLWEIEAEAFSRLVDINLKGSFHVLRAFLPRMIARGQGVVVNFSSGWGRSTSPGVAPYCASKYAIEGLSLALSAEVPPGVAVVPLNPGIIDTDMLRSCFGDEARRYPEPEQWVQKAVPFLLGLGPGDNGRALTVPS